MQKLYKYKIVRIIKKVSKSGFEQSRKETHLFTSLYCINSVYKFLCPNLVCVYKSVETKGGTQNWLVKKNGTCSIDIIQFDTLNKFISRTLQSPNKSHEVALINKHILQSKLQPYLNSFHYFFLSFHIFCK